MKLNSYTLKPGTTFSIAPDFGGNLIAWQIDGRPILYSPPGFDAKPEDFYHAGNPILFPSVGRTWDRSGTKPIPGRYRIYGHDRPYEMPVHGLLPLGRWTKACEDVADHIVTVQYVLSLPTDVLAKHYPFRVAASLRYTLKPSSVRIDTLLENQGATPAPFAFGLHPYFHVEDRANVQVQLPCRSRMRLDPELLIPVGAEPLTSPAFSLEPGKTYDMGFTDVFDSRAAIVDTKAGRSIRIEADESIETYVIYSQPEGKFICLEPWTRGLGAYETLGRSDWPAGKTMNILAPGTSRSIRIEYSVQ